MLKRFLKFFKNDDQEVPEFEGSYLDFLLSQVEPGVVSELEACDGHDPLLLVIAEILRVSMRGAWSGTIRRPLLDEHSPGPKPPRAHTPPPPPQTNTPPAPPATDPEPEEEGTLEEESGAVPLEVAPEEGAVSKTREYKTPAALRDAMRPSEDEEGVVPGAAPGDEESPGEPSDEAELAQESSTVEVDEEDEALEAEIIDEMEVEEEFLDETSELIEEISPIESTAEFDRSVLDSDEDEGDLPRIDQREVLQAGRVFLGLLIDNDRLPYDLQLGLEETMLARDLLVGYFVGNEGFEDRAQQLLRVVERKFSEGLFSQARILLQLFQTDRATRIRNDRNIFYEDMIQRLGIRRRHPVAPEVKSQLGKLTRGPDEVLELSRWLDKNLFIKLHLFVRQDEQVKTWRSVSKHSSLEGATENLLRFLPPRRWRPYYNATQSGSPSASDIRSLVRAHVNADTLNVYTTNQLRTCYFVLRAVGDTGLEGYLDTFFEWTRRAFEKDTTVFLPEIYRRSMSDTDTMRAVFLDVYNKFLRDEAEVLITSFTAAQIDEALDGAIAFIRSCNFDEVAPGNYNLGGFVYDQLFGVEYPTKEFAFKLHRLT